MLAREQSGGVVHIGDWIKLHRKLLYWEWYKDTKTKALFIHLLLKACYTDGKRSHGFTLKRGQIITTLPKLSDETGLSIQEIRTALAHLESNREITQRTTNKFRIITIEKWDFYQT